MRERWSDNQTEIQEELEAFLDGETPFSLFEKDQPPRKVFLRRIEQQEGKHLLIFVKSSAFRISNPQFAFLFYQKGYNPMRGFQIQPFREDDRFLLVPLPAEIFQVQRRKFPRFEALRDSNASLLFKNKARVYSSKIIDVSQEGALLRGNFSANVKVGDVISPLSLVLFPNNPSLKEFKVQIPEAKVMRLVDLGNDIRELGIHFLLKGDHLETLQEYIDIRTIEDAVIKKTAPKDT